MGNESSKTTTVSSDESLAPVPAPAPLAALLRERVPASNHWHRLRRYALTVVGSDLIDAVLELRFARTREEATDVLKPLIEADLLNHVTFEHDEVEDSKLFYRWKADADLVKLNSVESKAAEYDLVVIGAGSAGLTAANFAAKLGARVAMVERHRTGGDCTWTGCVPSKALIKAAKVAHYARHGTKFGVTTEGVTVDMATVRKYVQDTIKEVYQHETPAKIRENGVKVLMGEASFVDERTLRITETLTTDGTYGGGRRFSVAEVEGEESKMAPPSEDGVEPFSGASGAGSGSAGGAHSFTITAHHFLICTGARPAIPPTPGLDTVDYLTYENIFDVDVLPPRLIVMGTGPIGCELAQAFARFGSKVTIIGSRILGREEEGVQATMTRAFAADGMDFVSGRPSKVEAVAGGGVRVTVGDRVVEGDRLLVSTGRRPNLELNLEAAGVEYTRSGISTDGRLRTSVPHIYAAGDCTGGHQFTHYAGWQAFQATRNALIPGSSPGTTDLLPWCTYTSPEIAHVGMTEEEAKSAHGDKVTFLKLDNTHNDRSVCDDDVLGYTSISVLPDGTIVGATAVCERAGEVISEIVLAMRHGLKLRQVADAIHPYPSYSTAVWHMTSDEATRRFLNGTAGKLIKSLYNH